MTDNLDLSGIEPTSPSALSEKKLAARRSTAGLRGLRVSGGDATRTTNGEWMWRITLDLPEAMELELQALATAQGVAKDQIVREALVAFGIGDASHVVGICDGTHSDDDNQAELDAQGAWGRS